MKGNKVRVLAFLAAMLLLFQGVAVTVAGATVIQSLGGNDEAPRYEVTFRDANAQELERLFVEKGTDISSIAPDAPDVDEFENSEWRSANGVLLTNINANAVFMPVGIQSLFPNAQGTDLKQFVPQDQIDLYGVHLYSNGSLIQIVDGLELTFDVPYTIRVDFKINKIVEAGVEYTYDLPAALIGREGEEKVFTNGSNQALGSAKVENNKFIVVFTQLAVDELTNGIAFDFYYWCTQELKKTEVGTGEEIEVVIPIEDGEIKVEIIINRERAFPVVTAKRNAFLRHNPSYITWTIWIDAGKNYTEDVVLVDSLLDTGEYFEHKYYLNSFRATYENSGEPVDLPEPEWNEDLNAFTWHIPAEKLTDDIIVAYRSEVINGEQYISEEYEGTQIKFGNTVALFNKDETTIFGEWLTSEAILTVDSIQKTQEKSMTFVDEDGVHYVWHIRIMPSATNGFGMNLKHKTILEDFLPPWLAFEAVYSDAERASPISADTSKKPHYIYDAGANKVSIVWPDGVNVNTSVYIQTRLVEGIEDRSQDNVAYLRISGFDQEPPGSGAGSENGISKAAYRFDESTGTQKYKIVVNMGSEHITGVVLQDLFNSKYFNFDHVEVDGITLSQAGENSGNYTLRIPAENEIRLEMGELTQAKTVYIYLKLKPEYLQIGHTKMNNDAYLYIGVDDYNYDYDVNNNEWIYTSSAVTEVKLDHQLVKKFLTYSKTEAPFKNLNYNEMVWKLTAGRVDDGEYGDKYMLYIDTLGPHQTMTRELETKLHLVIAGWDYVGLSAINALLSDPTNGLGIRGELVTNDNGFELRLDRHHTSFTFNLYYVSVVDEDYIAEGNTKITNNAIERGTYLNRDEELTGYAEGDFVAQMLDKEGLRGESGRVTWRVTINESMQTLVNDVTLTPTVTLTDALTDDRLTFGGTGTIRFVNQDGQEVQNWTATFENKILQISFPSTELNNNKLVLDFDVVIGENATAANPFVNSVTMNAEGSYMDTSPEYVWEMDAGAGADTNAKLEILKTDSTKQATDAGYTLAGAAFVLYDMDDLTTPIQGPLTSSGDGKVTFTELKSNYYYVIQEVTAPDGFHLITSSFGNLSNAMRVLSTQNGDTGESVTIIPNDPMVGGFELHKKDLNGALITESPAVFILQQAGQTIRFADAGNGVYNHVSSGTITQLATVDGKLWLQGLPLGTYTLAEQQAPNGFYPDNRTWTVAVTLSGGAVVVDIDGDYVNNVLSVPNTPLTAGFVVEKTDAQNIRITQSAATFQLKLNGNPLTFTQADNVYTFDPNGQVVDLNTVAGLLVIEALPVGEYTLEETASPDGYLLTSDTWKVTVSASGASVSILVEGDYSNGTLKVPNNPAVAGFKLRKTDGEDALITSSSALFTMQQGNSTLTFTEGRRGEYTYNPDGDITLLATFNGILSVEGLPAGQYVITEEQAPQGHEPVDTKWFVEVESDATDATVQISGNFVGDTLTVVNRRLVVGGFDINKVNSNRNIITSGAAVFTIRNGDQLMRFTRNGSTYAYDPSGGETELQTVNGKLSVRMLPEGVYSMMETKAPSGYVRSNSVWNITIQEQNGAAQVTVSGDYGNNTLTVVNDYDGNLPKTGDFLDRNLIWLIFEVSAIALIVVLLYRLRARAKKR